VAPDGGDGGCMAGKRLFLKLTEKLKYAILISVSTFFIVHSAGLTVKASDLHGAQVVKT